MMQLEQRDYSQLFGELEYYRNRCSELEVENKRLREELQSLKATLSAVVAKSIDVKPTVKRKRSKKPGRKKGHVGKSRKRPEHIDARVTIDQTSCSIYVARVPCLQSLQARTAASLQISYLQGPWLEYTVKRRYCSSCKRQVSPPVPGVLPNEVFGLRLMLLIVSLKLLGLSYEKISGHFQLLFNLNITDAAINHAVMKVAEAFDPRYNQLVETTCRKRRTSPEATKQVAYKRQEPLAVGVCGKAWTVVYEVDRSR
ncbi:hypothetical protein Ngar_c09460 [Candidatus Nitrososphaera gargensis Ga9.2]|uniref:Uncharacterized protein n=1 Tax=Nitrososphaera gargensis (strain Ga9.2) TaxID=1237085 RepID=K0IGD3_NITGG|nr:hypothetical protein [Candidatus Nitrososphaera gargensis]AFU57888.1 hypothetical protein Ngar_c09460 [Candidatus Nitrososphaera gargensis Ga9.2]